MSSIRFEINEKTDQETLFEKEFLIANETGTYCSSSVSGCNTRKYHGIFNPKQLQFNHDNYILISSIDESIHLPQKVIQLASRKYDGNYYPSGFKHITEFEFGNYPSLIFDADGFVIQKELILSASKARISIVYTFLDAPVSSFEFRIQPMLAFRNMHDLVSSNTEVNSRIQQIENGIKLNPYPGFEDVFIQLSRKSEFIVNPDWYYNTVYDREQERGYGHGEDLFSNGYFKLKINKGVQLIVGIGFDELPVSKLKSEMKDTLKKLIPNKKFEDYLEQSATQFIEKKGDEYSIRAGFPWFGNWGRDTLIALPGLTLYNGKTEIFKSVLDTLVKDIKGGLLPNCGSKKNAAYNSADASLWLFWTIQKFVHRHHNMIQVWKAYGPVMKEILDQYENGTIHNIRTEENGLIHAGEEGYALTWMDAIVDGKPVTQRGGLAVELNALWYNAICFSIELAKVSGDGEFLSKWQKFPELIRNSFRQTFWNDELKYLADYVENGVMHMDMRPNQLFAISLPFSPVDEEMKKSILSEIKRELLTPRGLRSLSARSPEYRGRYFGDHRNRDLSYHQGTVWPWLIGHYCEATLNIRGAEGIEEINQIYEGFQDAIYEYGLGSIAEIYDGDLPQKPNGCISQAWSVAELLRTRHLISSYGANVETNQDISANVSSGIKT